jgi:hypothetical protein
MPYRFVTIATGRPGGIDISRNDGTPDRSRVRSGNAVTSPFTAIPPVVKRNQRRYHVKTRWHTGTAQPVEQRGYGLAGQPRNYALIPGTSPICQHWLWDSPSLLFNNC